MQRLHNTSRVSPLVAAMRIYLPTNSKPYKLGEQLEGGALGATMGGATSMAYAPPDTVKEEVGAGEPAEVTIDSLPPEEPLEASAARGCAIDVPTHPFMGTTFLLPQERHVKEDHGKVGERAKKWAGNTTVSFSDDVFNLTAVPGRWSRMRR